MMIHHVAIDVLFMVVSVQHIAAEMGFQTCDIFRKYGPILASVSFTDHEPLQVSTSLISLQSGQAIPADLVANKSVMFKQVGQSSLLVTKIDLSGKASDMIVNAQTGNVQANEEIMEIIASRDETRNVHNHLVVTIHDDLTMITYDSWKGRAYSFNMTTGEQIENSTFDHTNTGHRSSSLAVKDGKYCITGGNDKRELPMICYDKSNRKWTTSEKMKIKRAFHSSLWFNGVLYVCGGTIDGSDVDTCSLYNTSHDFIRNISIACGPTGYGRLYVVGGELRYAAQREYRNKRGKYLSMWSVSKLDRPNNCTDIAKVKSYYGSDTILDPFCPSIEQPATETITVKAESEPSYELPATEKTVKAKSDPKLQVQLQADLQERTGWKQLRFLRHGITIRFGFQATDTTDTIISLKPQDLLFIPSIFGSQLDHGKEYQMYEITIRVGQDPILLQTLNAFEKEKWSFEFRIHYSCSTCPKIPFAVIVVLARVVKEHSGNLPFQSGESSVIFALDSIIPNDRERYLFFKVPLDPKMKKVIDGETAWFVMNQWLTVSKDDKKMLEQLVKKGINT